MRLEPLRRVRRTPAPWRRSRLPGWERGDPGNQRPPPSNPARAPEGRAQAPDLGAWPARREGVGQASLARGFHPPPRPGRSKRRPPEVLPASRAIPFRSPLQGSRVRRRIGRSGPGTGGTPPNGSRGRRAPGSSSSRTLRPGALRPADDSRHPPEGFAQEFHRPEQLHPDGSGREPQAAGDLSGSASVAKTLDDHPALGFGKALKGKGDLRQIALKVVV